MSSFIFHWAERLSLEEFGPLLIGQYPGIDVAVVSVHLVLLHLLVQDLVQVLEWPAIFEGRQFDQRSTTPRLIGALPLADLDSHDMLRLLTTR